MNVYTVIFVDTLGREDEAQIEAPNLETACELFNAEFGDCAILDLY